MVTTSARNFRPIPLAWAANRRRWAIAEPQTPAPELFTKNTVFFAQILDPLSLALIHPSGYRDQHETERIKARHLVIIYAIPIRPPNCCGTAKSEYSDHTRSPFDHPFTLGPTASMIPSTSCPGTRGYEVPGNRYLPPRKVPVSLLVQPSRPLQLVGAGEFHVVEPTVMCSQKRL
jgi:hypothetical protein